MNIGTNQIWMTLLAAVSASIAAGCGSADRLPRKAIYGDVIGAEGRQGILTLIPAEAETAPSATTAVVNGRYKFTSATGPVPGEYVVILRLEGGLDGAPSDATGIGGKPFDTSKPRNTMPSLHEADRRSTLTVAKASSLEHPLMFATNGF